MKGKILFFLAFICQASSAQNLVPNASFEDINICSEFQAKCSPSGWFSVNRAGARGYQRTNMATISGEKHIEIVVANIGDETRGYWQTVLLCPVEPGKTYQVSLKVAAEVIGPNLNDIGLNFSDHFVFCNKDTLLQPKNYFTFLNGTFKKLKNGWFQLTKEFTATNGGKVLTIGNFSSKTNKEIFKEIQLQAGVLNYGIDDVEITAKVNSPCAQANTVRDSIYSIKERHAIIDPFHPLRETNADVTKEIVDTLVIDRVEFELNSYHLNNTDSLKNVSEYFKQRTIKKIRVVGYTDNSGTEAYNKELSLKRATAIALYIKDVLGFTGPMEVEGLGISTKYVRVGQNRRVEIYFYK